MALFDGFTLILTMQTYMYVYLYACISMYVRVHTGIAVLNGLVGKGMSSSYRSIGGRCRERLRQALIQDLKEESRVDWQRLHSNLLKLEKYVRSDAVGKEYNDIRDRLFLLKLCLHSYT